VIGAGNDKLWQDLTKVMGMPGLAEKPEFRTVPDRVAHHEELRKIIEEWTAKYTVQQIYDMVDGAGVPCAPIYSIDQVVKDPHIAGDRKMFVETEHPVAGKITLTGSHLKLSETCTDVRTPSPALGQDNENVYGELLGYSPEKVAELRAEGVL
jgi:formyl-CoA transferase